MAFKLRFAFSYCCIFVSDEDAVNGKFRILHKERLCDFYRSLIIVRIMKYWKL
jgi:hypothetical protein